jgi:56kDa selenium binding protein (SBP56)
VYRLEADAKCVEQLLLKGLFPMTFSAPTLAVMFSVLASVLRGQDQVFFFDVSDPRNPTFIRSDNPPDASITDEFAALSSGGFLVTFMGGANGSQPGRVVEYDAATALVQTWPSTPPPDGFNPHGLSIDEAHNLMVTSDFICALPTLHVHGGSTADLRGSVRVWDFARREITKTIVIGDPARPAGTMEVQLIPRDQRLRAYTAGMADNKLYLVDTQGGTAASVFDFDAFSGPNAPAMPQLLRMNRQGTRLFVTLHGAGMVVMFNIARPDHPEVMSVVDLGPGSGPHFLRLTSDENASWDGLLSGRRPRAGWHRKRGGRSQDSCDQRPQEPPRARHSIRRRFRSRYQHRARTPAWSGPLPGSRRVTESK